MGKIFLLAILLMTAGCERASPPVPDAQQRERLDEADAMLDALARNEAEAGKEKGATPEDAAPSENAEE